MEDTRTRTDEIKDNPNNLPVISYSKITTYKNCSKSYKFAYIDKLPRVDKPYTIFGQFCHKILENFHSSLILEPDRISDDKFLEKTMEKSFINAKEKWKSKLTKEQIQEAFKIAQEYFDDYNMQEKMPNVINTEKRIWTTIDDKLILNGFIDKVQIDHDGILHIVDYKTTKDERFLKDITQLLLYAYIIYLENKNIDKVRVSFVLLKHNMKRLISEHCVDELIDAKDKLLQTWDIISSDKLLRATPANWKCKGCDYLDHCKEGQNLIFKNKVSFGKVEW